MIQTAVRDIDDGVLTHGYGAHHASARDARGWVDEPYLTARKIEGAWSLRITLSPSRLADPDGWEVADAETTRRMVAEAVQRFAAVCEDLPASDEWRVHEIDLALDFRDVPDIHRTLADLALVDPKRCTRKQLFLSATGDNRYETLVMANGSAGFRLYDKCRQMETKGANRRQPPVGTLRLEFTLKKRWLEEPPNDQVGDVPGIHAVGDLQQADVEALFEGCWRWSLLGSVRTDPVTARRTLRQRGLSPRSAENVALRLADQASPAGLMLSTGQRDRFKTVRRKHPVVVSPSLLGGGVDVRSLDLLSRTELRVAGDEEAR